jgi:2'-5' RNA ligase
MPQEAKLGLASLLERLHKGMQFTGARPTWVEPDNLHLTLQFLGNQPEERVPDVISAMGEAVVGIPAFCLELAGLELFPTSRDPRVISLGIRGDVKLLTESYDKLTSALNARGFAVSEKPFRAHITVARIKSMKGLAGLRELVNSHSKFKAASFTAEGISLYSSVLNSTGPTYTMLGLQAFEAPRISEASSTTTDTSAEH